MSSPLLSVRGLTVAYDGLVAVDDVSFDLARGEVVAVVGESGSGKTTLALALVDLVPGATVKVGSMTWKGEQRRAVRGAEVGMVFQDPLSALNPVHTVGHQVAEVLRVHERFDRRRAWRRAVELLELVGIPEPARRARQHPHELSGGMRQRVGIAMAIACSPDLLIADEPTTALDVTVQAQVLGVLLGIKDAIDSAILLITHDLGVVAGVADRVLVLYAGKLAEQGTADEVFSDATHPYTRGLLAALPRLDAGPSTPLVPIAGAPPSLADRPIGCPFHPRCPSREVPGVCVDVEPRLSPVAGEHLAACHFAQEVRRGER